MKKLHRITPIARSGEVDSYHSLPPPDNRAEISRRDFYRSAFYLIGGGALVAALARIAGLPSALQSIKLPDIASVPDSHMALKRSVFASHLGEEFQITRGATVSIEATLVEVTGVGSGHLSWMSNRRLADPEQVFSMLFRGSRTVALEQETYLFHHREIGWVPLFIVPISQDSEVIYYEAIVNRQSV